MINNSSSLGRQAINNLPNSGAFNDKQYYGVLRDIGSDYSRQRRNYLIKRDLTLLLDFFPIKRAILVSFTRAFGYDFIPNNLTTLCDKPEEKA